MHSKRENSSPKTEGKREEDKGSQTHTTEGVCVEFVGEEGPGLIVKGHLCVGETVA